MKMGKLKTLMCLALLASLVACTPEKKEEKVRVAVNSQMSSDELTLAGEQLVGPFTFHLADRAFAMALEKNPKDMKAQFYRSFLKRFMVFQGVLNRIVPYALEYGDVNQLKSVIKEIPEHPLRTFLLDNKGKSDIGDLNGIQVFLTEYRDALQGFREFVSKNPNLEFDIYLNPHVFQDQIKEKMTSSCVSTYNNQPDGFEVVCDFKEVAKVKVNVADLMVLKQLAAGEQLYFTLLTSYSLQGLDGFLKEREQSKQRICETVSIPMNAEQEAWDDFYSKTESADEYSQSTESNDEGDEILTAEYCKTVYPELSSKDLYAQLSAVPAALKLRKNNGLAEVKKIGSDMSSAVKWVVRYQNRLCPKGYDGGFQNRPGYLFESSLCVENISETKQSLAAFDLALSGVIKIDRVLDSGHVEKISVNYMAPFENPIKDLRSVMPATYDKCGEAASLKDPTFGGLFPNGDVVILANDRCGLK